jgi:maltose alpha-D-glucosyltransferase / alpha-amylase
MVIGAAHLRAVRAYEPKEPHAGMPGLDLWYKNAIVYCIDVETYLDANGDGVGDFEGLTRRLDYLAGLGVTCVWLLPFYPTPNRDNGYDVTDFYGVDPRLGTLGDFVEFLHQAHMRGIRVIIDLVVNHTSDQHPWFQAARRDANSPYRDYYVWSAERPANADEGVVFPGVQEAIWSYDRAAKAWYHHRFYQHQPDLNMSNPAVRAEIRKIMGFWLALGVSGFRMDAAPFVIEDLEGDDAEAPLLYHYLREFRDFLSWRTADAIILAEANVEPARVQEYFGDGNRLQMMFNFWVNQHLFLAFARQEPEPLVRALTSLPPIPEAAQWATFLRNHDEIDLGRLSTFERSDAFQAFGPEPEMQLYERGVRRRLAPMLDGDLRRLRLAYSLLFTLPGTPVLWYGEEIGMGDDLTLPERNSVRTPMQWCAEPNAGYSTGPADALIRPVVSEGEFGYERVNVADQQRDPDSLLNCIEKMIRVRKEHHEFGWGSWKPVDVDHASVFAIRCEYEGNVAMAVHNFSRKPCDTALDLPEDEWRDLFEILADSAYEPADHTAHRMHLEGYGYRWFRRGRLGL